MTTRALVLGGGGTAGIAWETGVLAGLAESGVDVRGADLVVGTSAGSAVAAQVASGLPFDQLVARQVDPARQSREITPTVDVAELLAAMQEVDAEAAEPVQQWRKLGELALSTDTVAEADRLTVIESRLPVHEWPDRAMRLVAVDAATGEPAVFDKDSGVSLVDAVAASCAVPGVWPPVTIGTARYMDGGVRSIENADLAAGYNRVLVLQAMEMPGTDTLGRQIEHLRAGGSAVEVIRTDEASRAAIGVNPLDPETRAPACRAGVAQGRAEAARISAFWL
ncbi:MAG TPA: patatin-like phospholipase family protein [Pseudonocardiaceae bacterium]|jgi:NTE family protein|nr:patatin-like phospholipase family protein [Pseudonocardiaceae bacterium]